MYLVVGVLIVRVSDYGWNDLEAYPAVVCWLPLVVYSFVPDKYRVEK